MQQPRVSAFGPPAGGASPPPAGAAFPPRLDLGRLWLLLGVALPLLGASLAPLSTVDLAYAVRLGQEALASPWASSPTGSTTV